MSSMRRTMNGSRFSTMTRRTMSGSMTLKRKGSNSVRMSCCGWRRKRRSWESVSLNFVMRNVRTSTNSTKMIKTSLKRTKVAAEAAGEVVGSSLMRKMKTLGCSLRMLNLQRTHCSRKTRRSWLPTTPRKTRPTTPVRMPPMTRRCSPRNWPTMRPMKQCSTLSKTQPSSRWNRPMNRTMHPSSWMIPRR